MVRRCITAEEDLKGDTACGGGPALRDKFGDGDTTSLLENGESVETNPFSLSALFRSNCNDKIWLRLVDRNFELPILSIFSKFE